jgi:peptide/nickel transport system substrate-binding protein
LVRIREDGRFEPGLFEQWTASEDGSTWTFRLRAGVKMHDGSPATASLVKAVLDAEVQQSGAGPGFEDVASVSARDESTVEIQLRNTAGFLFFDDLSVTLLMRRQPGSPPVGAGPYQLVESSGDGTTVLRAFPDYYQGPPTIPRIEIRTFPTARAAWAAMMRDEIDFLYEVGREALDFVEAESAVQVYSFPRPYAFLLGFNVRHPALARKEVRRALNFAVNREQILQTALRGRGRRADGFIWPAHWAFDRSVPTFAYDRRAAVRLLDQTGLSPRRDADGRERRLRLACLLPSDWPFYETMALVVQRQLYDVGVDLDLEPVPAQELTARLQKGDFDVFLFNLANARRLSWPYRFLHTPGPGRAALVNWGYAAADTVLDRIRYARSDDEVRAAVAELQRVLYYDPPAVFIAWDERARAVSRRFQIPGEPRRDILQTLWQWRPVPPRAALRAAR